MASPILPTEVQAAAKREGFSASEYNAVAMGARLSTIKLVKLHLDTGSGRGDDVARKLAFNRQVLSCRFDTEASLAAAIFQFNVSVLTESDELFQCAGDYAVLYDMPAGAKPEAATSFCKHVGSFAAYPYFRAVAAQMAWNAGVDLPPLPSIAAMPIVPKPEAKVASDTPNQPKVAKRRSKRTT